MHVLVTGASGLIGAQVARVLSDAGFFVRGFSRTQPPADAAVDEHFTGDLTDLEAVLHAAEGCEAIFHVGALYSYSSADRERMAAVNVDGTRNVLAAARLLGGLRTVVTSTSATCGPVPGRPATEQDGPPRWELRIPYKGTKLAAEHLCLHRARQGQDVVLVNPTTTLGPGDARPTPSGKMIRDVVDGRVIGYIPGAGLNIVSVADVARGHLLAFRLGRSGERYILGGEDLSLREVFTIAARHAGVAPPILPLPYPLVFGVAAVAKTVGGAFDREPGMMRLDEVRLAQLPMHFSSAKAQRELGYEATSAESAIADSVSWFRRCGSARRRLRFRTHDTALRPSTRRT